MFLRPVASPASSVSSGTMAVLFIKIPYILPWLWFQGCAAKWNQMKTALGYVATIFFLLRILVILGGKCSRDDIEYHSTVQWCVE